MEIETALPRKGAVLPETFIGPPMAIAQPESAAPVVASITTIDLTSRTCRWPFGDPTASDFHYCGQLPQKSLPYCATHASMSRHSHRRMQTLAA